MLAVLSTSTCDICVRKYKTDGARAPSIIPCGHIMCRRCLSVLNPRACPYCRAPFRWDEVHNVQCELVAPGASTPPPAPAPPTTSDRAARLSRRIAQVLVPPDEDTDTAEQIVKCIQLLDKTKAFLMSCGSGEHETLHAKYQTLTIHIANLRLVAENARLKSRRAHDREAKRALTEELRGLRALEEAFDDLHMASFSARR